MANNRIILSTANFSANNIGRYVEVSDLTKKVLEKQTQYEEGSPESLALDTFLNEITEAGFIGGESPKLKYLIIPVLANDGTQLFYNIAHLDGSGYPSDDTYSAEKSATTKSFLPYHLGGVQSNKIIGLIRDNTENRISQTDSNNQSYLETNLFEGLSGQAVPSFGFMFYGVKGNTVTTAAAQQRLFETLNGYGAFSRNDELVVGSTSKNSSNGYISSSASSFTGENFFGFAYDKENAALNILNDEGTFSTPALTGTNTNWTVTSGRESKVIYGVYAYNTASWWANALIACGLGITSSDLSTFRTSVHKLMVALGIRQNS